MKRFFKIGSALVFGLALISSLTTAAAAGAVASGHTSGPATTTPIKHLVVIFQENVSFDDYFGTYPYATNPAGEPSFHAAKNTPTVNGLSTALLQNNPNAANPTRPGSLSGPDVRPGSWIYR